MDLVCSPSQTKSIVHRAIIANQPIFLWGPPGIGKSDIVAQVAKKIGNCLLIDLRLALLEPTDLRGYPFRNPETNQMEWAPPTELPSPELAAQYDHIILFLDELNSAPPSVQAAAYQLILNRRIGQYQLPDNVRIVAAGNRETDRGVTYRMPAPLANRFRHCVMTYHFEDWRNWALSNNVHVDVIGYLSYAESDLFDFNPKTASQAFATPRSWTFVSGMLAVPEFETADLFEQKAEIAGAVGDGMASKFVEHRRVAAWLSDPKDIIAGKVKKMDERLSGETGVKFSLVIGLTYELDKMYQDGGVTTEFKKAFNNVVRYAYDNFEAEMVIFFFKTVWNQYKMKINIRTDFDKDLYKVFSDRYSKYVV